ncbi:MAG: hypothetical protein NC900_06505 [Candidatus Omnitrophica bacterium]|nr:hypothetical protein [Candidatus Omnitrophota bacterium]
MKKMEKMALIAYNEAIDEEVKEILEKCGLKNFTKIMQVFGRGQTSGLHLGNDIWPGRNNILLIACEEKQKTQLLSYIRELRRRLGKEGIKAFVWNLEEIT